MVALNAGPAGVAAERTVPKQGIGLLGSLNAMRQLEFVRGNCSGEVKRRVGLLGPMNFGLLAAHSAHRAQVSKAALLTCPKRGGGYDIPPPSTSLSPLWPSGQLMYDSNQLAF